MPLVSQTFDQLINFTRTSAATYVNSAGLVALTPASRNLLTFTQEFDNAAWTKTGATVTANSTTAPDGTNTADKVVETAATGGHSAAQTLVSTAGTVVTYSVYLKAAERTFAGVYAGVPGRGIIVNLSNGAFVSNMVAAPSSYIITPISSGWYRVSITYTTTGTSTVSAVYTCDASAAFSYTGNGTSGIYVWGAQLEAGSTATDYTKNVGGLYPPRFDYDPVTLAPKGLLIEEQRTNLLTYSEQFDNAAWIKVNATVSADATTAPDGTSTADKLIENTAASTNHYIDGGANIAGIPIVYSVYAKAAGRSIIQMTGGGFGAQGYSAYFNLSNGTMFANTGSKGGIVDVGNGWYRCYIAFTPSTTGGIGTYLCDGTGNPTYTGNGTSGIYVWGAQLEAGAFATSYIPTVASQVTRTADTAVINAPNFAPWYNQSEGTFVAELSYFAAGDTVNAKAIFAATDGTSNNRVYGNVNTASQPYVFAATGGVAQANIGTGVTVANNAVAKLAAAYKANDFAGSTNGAAVVTDTSGTVPAVDRLGIGNSNNFNQINGHIRSIRYYPTRLSNAQLQALTA